MVVTLSSHYYAIGQSTCAQTLRLGQSVYDQGRLHELPQLLEGCLRNGFSDQEKANAYKLLTLTYIYLEEPEKADESMLALLRLDHEFKINDAVDPAEFVALYKTFRTAPIYRIGAKLGSSISQPNVVSYNPVNSGASNYEYGFGFNATLSAEIPLTFNKALTINPELGLAIKSFQYLGEVKDFNESIVSTTTGKETQNWISLPLSVQYKITKSKLNPYIGLGGTVDYLLSANINSVMLRPTNQSIEERSFQSQPLRENININATASAGMKTPIKGGFLTAEVRFYYGLSKINSRETLLDNQFLINDYQYADGIFRLNALSLTVGYAYNIFNPIKLKK
jgi:hypothetical protein